MSIPESPSTSRRETWFRGLFVLLFSVLYCLTKIVVLAVVILQFGFVLISGRVNQQLVNFGESASQYIYQILQFMTFYTDQKPFPFSSWSGSKEPPAPEAPSISTDEES